MKTQHLRKNALQGWISTPATLRGMIYVGLFTNPIPQGRPVRCTKLNSPGWYLLNSFLMASTIFGLPRFPSPQTSTRLCCPARRCWLAKAHAHLSFVFGHSSGAALALEAAVQLGDKVKKLAMYEAPYNDESEAQRAWRA